MASKTSLTAEFRAETRQFFRALGNIDVGIGGVVKSVAGIGAAAGAAGAAMAAIWAKTIKGSAAAADELGKMAARTGLSTEALQRLQLASTLVGADLGNVEKATRRMSGTILDLENGLSTPRRAFERLGLTLDDVKGKTPEKQFEALMTALAGVEDASTRAALAEDIFGRSGTALLPMIEKGATGFRNLMRERDRLGLLMTDDQIEAAEEFNDSIARMGAGLKALGFQAVADSFGPLANEFNEFATSGNLERILPALRNLSNMFRDLSTMALDILQTEAVIAGVQLAAESIGAAAQAVSELTGKPPVEQATGRAAIEREGATILGTLPAVAAEAIATPNLGMAFAGMGGGLSNDMLNTLKSIDQKMPAAPVTF